jgi:phosphatidylglycerophosphate synthase
MRKIPNHLENPIDNLVYVLVEFLAPYCHMLKMTPNFITTLSIISGLSSAYFIFTYKFGLSAIFYTFAYIFDCLDGYVARKYNMVTKFGDMYDHFGDIIKVIMIIIAFCYVNTTLFLYFLPILLYLFFMSCMHLGCQENHYKLLESDWLNGLKLLCSVKNEKELHAKMMYTKYFGVGTFTLGLILIMLVYREFYRIN